MRRRFLPALLLCLPALADARVRTGLDVLEASGFSALRGKRVGLITNQTGVDSRGRHAADLLAEAPGVTLAAIFSPEHGFTGRVEHGQKVSGGLHGRSRVPIHSLYGETKRPTAEMLAGLDALVFDIQDVGSRFYTYVTTLAYALEEAAARDIEFFVLDRPNPLGGLTVEGRTLDESIRHFTAYYSVPTRHGLTVGELARWHAGKKGLNVRLNVVKMEGWRRADPWERTGLKFVPPSPNIRSPKTALLYCGIGAFESTNVAVGRGTARPFEIFGAPWLDAAHVAAKLNELSLPGATFRRERFSPKKDRYKGELCEGVRVIVTDPDAVRPVDIFVHAACLIRDRHFAEFQPRWAEMPFMVGSREFETLFTSGAPAERILKDIHAGAARFLEERKPFLLYE